MSTKIKVILYAVVAVLAATSIVLAVRNADAAAPADFGLTEGDVIRAQGDLDVYIVNDWGFKRLFVNPAIFGIYGHLGFDKVKNVVPSTRDAFVTSGLFRNCESGDQKVYGLEVVSEDVAKLHWVNMSGSAAVAEDANFFNKVFCINNAEQALYGVGTPFTSLSQIPAYARGETTVGGLNVATLSAGNLAGQTIPANASGVKVLSVDFKGNGAVNSLTVKRLGFQPASSYADIFLYKNGVRLDTPRDFDSNGIATFNSLGLTAPFALDVVVNFNGAIPSSPAQVELQGAYSGLPLKSNQFLFATVAGSTINFGSPVAVDDVVIGQSGAKVGEFKFSVPSGDEDITVKSVQLRHVGTADISNVRMVIDGVTYPGLALEDDDFLFTTNFTVNDGKSKKVELFADISSNTDVNDTVQFKLVKSYDVSAIGSVYGFGVNVGGAGTFASTNTIIVLSGGSLTSSTVSGDKVVALWGQSNVQLFQFKLKANDESFAVSDLVFAVHPSVSAVSVYDGATLLGSVNVALDESVATVSADFTLTGERTFTVKANFRDQGDTTNVVFTPSLLAVTAVGVGSDTDAPAVGVVSGDNVYVYPAYPKFARTDSFSSTLPPAWTSVLEFSVEAIGGDIKLASASNAFEFEIDSYGMPNNVPYKVYVDGVEYGSGVWSSASANFNPVLDDEVDEVTISEGDSVLVLVKFDFTGADAERGFQITLKDSNVSWLVLDSEDDWVSLTSVVDTLSLLPIESTQFYREP